MKPQENDNEDKLTINKNRFFESLFCCSRSENSALANEIIRLCSILKPQYKEFFFEVQVLVEEARKHLIQLPSRLSIVYGNLIEMHLLTERYLAAFIAVQLQQTQYPEEQYDQYKALSLIVIMHLSSRGDHNHSRLCNELRQCALGNREELIQYLPNILISDLSSLIQSFVELQHLTELDESPIQGQLSCIKAPYEYAYRNKRKIKRKVNPRKFKKQSHLKSVN